VKTYLDHNGGLALKGFGESDQKQKSCVILKGSKRMISTKKCIDFGSSMKRENIVAFANVSA